MTDPQTWTLIGGFLAIMVWTPVLVLRTLASGKRAVNTKIDGAFGTIDAKIDGLSAEMNGRFAAVDARFAAVNGRIHSLDREVQ